MASSVKQSFVNRPPKKQAKKKEKVSELEELKMSGNEKDDEYINDDFDGDDFDFVEAYDDDPAGDERLLPDNEARCAINCAFIGVGGGGGKLAKAFLDLGFNKTILVNNRKRSACWCRKRTFSSFAWC